MKVEELDQQFNSLKTNIENYYAKITSKQKEDIVLGDTDIIVDYLVSSLGTYEEAYIKKLTPEHILVYDKSIGKNVIVDLDQLTIQDRIQILEIYEEKMPELCL